jgi:transposase
MKNISPRLDHDKLHFFWYTIILLTAISFSSTQAIEAAHPASKISDAILPPYSPNLNPIERAGKVMNEHVRNNKVSV